jgi:hypothetical protein
MTSKLILCLIGSFALVSCTTQTASAPYRPLHSESQWLIDGQISPTYVASFYVNGQLAAQGQLSGGSGGIVRGEYKAHPVSVTCKHTKNMWGTEDDCDVFVDQELATRLHFSK